MRISDLSSDVCSSDLVVGIGEQALRREQEGRKVRGQQFVQLRIGGGPIDQGSEIVADNHLTGGGGLRYEQLHFLDEASGRDRREIGREHGCTPVPNTNLVCSHLLAKNTQDATRETH